MDHLSEAIDGVMEDVRPAQYFVTIVDGYAVNSETGEVYGLVEDCVLDYAGDDEYLFTPGVDRKTTFAIDSHESADWVLGKRFDAEASLKSIEAQRAAMNENFDRMEQVHKDRLNSLSRRFDAELENFARANLPRGKKTLTLPHGSIAFRTVPAGVSLVDEERAIAWAKMTVPHIVRESITKTDASKAWNERFPGLDLPSWLQAVPARESVTIKTGL